MDVENPVGAREGDIVTVYVPDGLLLRAAFFAYGLPMLGFMLGGLLGHVLAQGTASRELVSVLSALAGMALALIAQLRFGSLDKQPMGRIVRVDKGKDFIPVLPGA